jgi:copper homeostasis protein
VSSPAGPSACSAAKLRFRFSNDARVELCAGLIEGGTTPSIGMVRTVLTHIATADVQVMIRPRGGDFRYTATELAVMLADIAAVRAAAADAAKPVGFVLGALTLDDEVDVAATRSLVDACGDAPVTFHKAFDATSDLGRSLDALVEVGVQRVLTSGGAARAVDGISALAGLARRAGSRITVIAGGSVRPDNVAHIVARTGVTEVHLRATHGSGQSTTGQATSANVVRQVLAAVSPT